MGLAQAKTGILRTVAGAPMALVKGLARTASSHSGEGTPTSLDASLANQWVDFLIEQADAADAVAAQEQRQNGSKDDHTADGVHSMSAH